MNTIKELYHYRQMIVSLVRKELRGRYKGSVLGFLWTFMNPLLQLIVYTIVFSSIMKVGIDKFYLFLFVALIPWMFFSASVTGGAASVISQGNLIKKVYFPRQVLPVSYVTTAFVNMALTFVIVFLALLTGGIGINIKVLAYLPMIMAVEYLLALGIAMLASALTVFFRDLEYILGIITMAWMYLTPVMYDVDMIPEQYTTLFRLNPMTPVIIAYRDILYYKQAPQVHTLMQAAVLGILVLIVGCAAFSLLQKYFAEEL